MSKAYNREQAEKALMKAKAIIKGWSWIPVTAAERIAHRMRDNRKRCSCNMCRNQRHSAHFKGMDRLPIQERRALLDSTNQESTP